MSKSLADLRLNPPDAVRPERPLTVCLRGDLVARVQTLADELASVPIEVRDPETGETDGPPRKMVKSDNALKAESLSAELQSVLAEMAEFEGELRLRGIDDGEWRRWVSKHPARAKDEPGYDRDREVARGYCNADALIGDLARYAYAWNGSPFAEGEFEKLIWPSMSGPDKKAAANLVVAMHEVTQDFRQWRSGLSDSLKRFNDSVPPVPSKQAPADSTAGSPEPSNAGSTPTADPAP